MMSAIVEELNERVPDLALAYDKESDSLKGLEGSLEDYTKAVVEDLYNSYKIEANKEYIVEKLKEQAEAQRLLNEQTDTYEEVAQAAQEAQDKLNAAYNAKVGAEGTYVTYDQQAAEVLKLSIALDEANAKQNEALENMNAAQANLNAIDNELNNAKTELEALLSSANATGDAATAGFQALKWELQNVCDNMSALVDAYNEVYDAAYDSIDKQTGLFKSFNNETKISARKLQAKS